MYKSICAADTKALQRFRKPAERLGASLLTPLNNIFTSRSVRMSCSALKDSFHPANHLLQVLPSGKHTDPLKQAPHDSFPVLPQSHNHRKQSTKKTTQQETLCNTFTILLEAKQPLFLSAKLECVDV